MKINERFSLKRDRYQWILTEHNFFEANKGKNAGQVIDHPKETYHGNLQQVANHILNIESVGCESLDNLIYIYGKASEEITRSLESALKSPKKTRDG